MSAKVISLNARQKQIHELIDQSVEASLPHKNPRVLTCLKADMETLVEKHFNTPAPEMTLPLPKDLTAAQFQQIKTNFQQLFSEHNEHMIQRSNAIFRDLYLSRLEVCELKYGDSSPD
jgi:hypothetical protein